MGGNPENPMITKSGDTVWDCSSESIVCIQNSITPLDRQRIKEYVTLTEDCEELLPAGIMTLASHQGGPSSNPGGVAPEISHVGIVLDDAAGRRVFSGTFLFPRPCIPALLLTHLASLSSALRSACQIGDDRSQRKWSASHRILAKSLPEECQVKEASRSIGLANRPLNQPIPSLSQTSKVRDEHHLLFYLAHYVYTHVTISACYQAPSITTVYNHCSRVSDVSHTTSLPGSNSTEQLTSTAGARCKDAVLQRILHGFPLHVRGFHIKSVHKVPIGMLRLGFAATGGCFASVSSCVLRLDAARVSGSRSCGRGDACSEEAACQTGSAPASRPQHTARWYYPYLSTAVTSPLLPLFTLPPVFRPEPAARITIPAANLKLATSLLFNTFWSALELRSSNASFKPTSRGVVGWCASDPECGRLWVRIPVLEEIFLSAPRLAPYNIGFERYSDRGNFLPSLEIAASRRGPPPVPRVYACRSRTRDLIKPH
ncbi:hypothetical protein PR048_030826 [Dryococelus australis]|uniref:Uncharacterized protein n=1 Tax=Dryococelus australis TaxID=614101 RepID=A0ABQ9GA02_9NEOP|nr:hypothetical protein PR048_030826 [Dryococelus australis]